MQLCFSAVAISYNAFEFDAFELKTLSQGFQQADQTSFVHLNTKDTSEGHVNVACQIKSDKFPAKVCEGMRLMVGVLVTVQLCVWPGYVWLVSENEISEY